MTAAPSPSGLRERKKLRTREALVDAAFDLFSRKGFEATTIDEIAEAVELSPRTFFRYFDSKEDVALTLLDQQFTAMYAAFATRPADEPVITALRHAVVDMMGACERGTDGFDAGRFACSERLMRSSPAVHARSLELSSGRLSELAGHVARRMGVDPVADPRPILIAAIVATGMQAAILAWREADPGRPMAELADRALGLLEAGLNYPSARS
jgi:AcrR family transcriptional regulator